MKQLLSIVFLTLALLPVDARKITVLQWNALDTINGR